MENIVQYPYIAQFTGYILPQNRGMYFGRTTLPNGHQVALNYPFHGSIPQYARNSIIKRIQTIQKSRGTAAFVNTRVRDWVGVLLLNSVSQFHERYGFLYQANIKTDLAGGVDAYTRDSDFNPEYGFDLTSGDTHIIGSNIRKNDKGILFEDEAIDIAKPIDRRIIFIQPAIYHNIANAVERLLKHTTTDHHIRSLDGCMLKDDLIKRRIQGLRVSQLSINEYNGSPIVHKGQIRIYTP